MADVTVKHIDDLDSYEDRGTFMFARKGLGVTSFGMNVERFPAGYADYPDHDHETDGQEEVYFVVEGSVALQAGDESFELTPGTFARVGPGQTRKLVPGDQGVTLLAIGGKPGAFEANV
ncbi:MAG TPA: cupin domain-containing protein [Gaiellaceae bacterium]|nr:cupin domain-containing protein [Gaiellaceae bacterium]